VQLYVERKKKQVFVLANIHVPAAEGNSTDKYDNIMKSLVIDDCNAHMGYVDKSD
jgi:hypothetical protein